jgi:hypothetical protein
MVMTKQPEKIQVRETKRFWGGDFEGPLVSIISSLQSDLDDGWEGIEIYSIGYDGALDYYLYKHRLETDKEYKKRMELLEKEKQRKLKQKEKRHKEYQKLKKEFGNE